MYTWKKNEKINQLWKSGISVSMESFHDFDEAVESAVEHIFDCGYNIISTFWPTTM